jgi:hypothetical protein
MWLARDSRIISEEFLLQSHLVHHESRPKLPGYRNLQGLIVGSHRLLQASSECFGAYFGIILPLISVRFMIENNLKQT